MNTHVNAENEQPKQDGTTIPRTEAEQDVETETTSEDEERWTSYVRSRFGPTYEEVIETTTGVLGNIMKMHKCEQALGKFTEIILLYKNYTITKREASARLEDLEYTVLCDY